jgi:TrmH family RNA methyltransferase
VLSFKELLKLTQKKYRREMGLCIVEGEKLVREHLGDAAEVFMRDMNLTAREFERVSGLETPEGIMAVVPIPTPKGVTFPYVVLDGIQDAGNVGTLLRSAKAFGFDTVFCLNCADVWSQKVIRSAMGAQFGLNIYEKFNHAKIGGDLYIADMPEIVEAHANPAHAASHGAHAHGRTTPPLSVERPETTHFGIVLGNEGHGVSAQMRELPHKIVSIPQKKGVESLNVAVAGGIIMYVWA